MVAIYPSFSYYEIQRIHHSPTIREARMKSAGIKKLYYSISEVSKITDLEQYVLRYWESEFEQLKPSKNRAGNRIYTNKDIKLILYIRQLLREERYTIEGAKQVLKTWSPEGEAGQQLTLLPDAKPEQVAQSVAVAAAVAAATAAESAAASVEEASLKADLVEIKTFLEELLTRLN